MNQSVTSNRGPLSVFMSELLQEKGKKISSTRLLVEGKRCDSFLIVDDNARLQQHDVHCKLGTLKHGPLQRETSGTSMETTSSMFSCMRSNYATYADDPPTTTISIMLLPPVEKRPPLSHVVWVVLSRDKSSNDESSLVPPDNRQGAIEEFEFQGSDALGQDDRSDDEKEAKEVHVHGSRRLQTQA